MRILLVEDDPQLGDGLTIGLRQAGFAVDWLKDGHSADLALQAEAFDFVVLDLGLPRLSGMEVLTRARGRGQTMPVLILTARDTSADKVAGLDAGADDYLTKPFDLPELLARLRAIIRRATGDAKPTLEHAGVVLDPSSKQVTFNGQPIALSAREYALLLDFLRNRNSIRTRAQLEESLYAWGEETGSNTVEVFIHHLRKKFGADFIRTIRGLGYQLGSSEGR